MNIKRIIVGGLLAGLIISVGETILSMVVIGKNLQAEMHGSAISAMPIGVFVLRCSLLGIGCVLLYAAMRPRLGPGAKSAVTAGILVFLLGVLFPPFGLTMTGFSPSRVLLVATIWDAIEIPLAAVAGAWLYCEETSEMKRERPWRGNVTDAAA